MVASRRFSSGSRRLIAGLATSAIGLAGLVAIAAPASAAELNAITDVKIASTVTNPVEVHSQVQVDAKWAVDSSAQPGDTFTLELPVDKSFAIPAIQDFSLATADGSSAGTCKVSQQAITCTLNSYVTTHTNVKGTLHFWMTAQAPTATSSVTFTADGKAVVVQIPGGPVVNPGSNELPNKPFKDGFSRPALGDIRWGIYATGDQLLTAGSSAVSITDTYDSKLSFVPSSLSVYVVPNAVWTSDARWTGGTYLKDTQYTLTPDDATSSFTIAFNDNVIKSGNVYAILYSTSLPANVKSGDVFTNKATGSGVDASDSVTYALASGTADGSSLRAIALTKKVAGSDAPDGPFTFALSCRIVDPGSAEPVSTAGTTETKSVRADDTVVFGDIPVGSTCWIKETDSLGGTVSYDATWPIKVTADSPLTINVVATNTFTTQEVTGSPTLSVGPTETVAATASETAGTATAAAPAGSGLASTGAAVATTAGAALLLIVAGAALMIARRRRTA